jgi:hypothetical protein
MRDALKTEFIDDGLVEGSKSKFANLKTDSPNHESIGEMGWPDQKQALKQTTEVDNVQYDF